MNSSKSIFIIKSKSKQKYDPDTFLREKGYNICSANDLKEGLVEIIKNKPTLVFLCLDHPDKKVFLLPKYINKAFKTTIVGYSDCDSKFKPNDLTEYGLNIYIESPLSEEKFERVVHFVLHGKETIAGIGNIHVLSGLTENNELSHLNKNATENGENTNDETMNENEQAQYDEMYSSFTEMYKDEPKQAKKTVQETIVYKSKLAAQIKFRNETLKKKALEDPTKRRYSTSEKATVKNLKTGIEVAAVVRDISQGGAFLELLDQSLDVKVGDVVYLSINFQNLGKVRNMNASVRWIKLEPANKQKIGMGVQFLKTN